MKGKLLTDPEVVEAMLDTHLAKRKGETRAQAMQRRGITPAQLEALRQRFEGKERKSFDCKVQRKAPDSWLAKQVIQ